MKKKDKYLNVHYSLILGAYWMIFAVSSIFVVPLLRSRGFSNLETGILISIRSFSAIVISPIIASFSDRHPSFQLKYTLMLLLTINIVNTLIFQYGSPNYLQTVFLFIILGATTNTMPPLHSSLSIKFLEAGRPVIYSIGRGVGSVSYAVICLLLGYLVGENHLSVSLTLQILLDIFSLILLLFFPRYTPVAASGSAKSSPSAPHSNWYLLKNYPYFTLFLISSVFIFVGYSMCNSFMIDIITSRGGTNSDLGISCFILGIVELPTALLFPRLKVKLGVKRLLRISASFALLKMIFLYLSPNVLCIFLSQTLQMLGNGMYWPASVHYVTETIDSADQVKGQALTTIASVNIGAILGSSVSGKLLCYYSIDSVIMFGCICSFIGVIFMYLAMSKKSSH